MISPTIRSVPMMTVIVATLYGATGCDEGETLPYDQDCHLYYKCQEGDMVLFQCDQGLGWNRRINSCDFQHNVQACDPKRYTYDADPKDDTKFYRCSYDGCDHISCSDGSVFMPGLGGCHFPSPFYKFL